MSIYLRQDEIKPGALVRAMSRDNEIVPALILDSEEFANGAMERFVRVMYTDGETFLMNVFYLERWK
jgi:hypothetical protein